MTAADEITQLVRYVRLAERLRASIVASRHLVEIVHDVAVEDPSLAPEISAAVESVTEAVEALARAEEFARTRLEVMLDEG